ncbi:alpha-L-rhamnosidase [Klebsiella variicola]|uniref:Alpha-L-rhamnosidase n=1 Tax=Klebsiella variicola TaxID=244366 RepID=A0A7H4MKZ5_KLEVA|nr:alpha-L-rhamnosidase [Klebsiella variicola]
MRRLQQQPPAIAMNTPYLRHHHIVALLQCGLREEAVAEIKAYWGAMVDSGADTFWEIFDPQHPELFPRMAVSSLTVTAMRGAVPRPGFIRQYGL